MSSQERGRLALTAAVATSYYKCCKETPVTLKNFISLTQDFIRYYHTQHQHNLLLNCKARDYKDELGEVLRPILELYTTQSNKHGHLDHTSSALLDLAAIIAILISSKQSSQDGHDKPSEVFGINIGDFEDILKVLLCCNASSREVDISLIVSKLLCKYTSLPIGAQLRSVACLLGCVKDIRRHADRLPIKSSWITARDTVVSDLRNAFRGQFYESRNENGLSSLNRLNLSLRANLFMSHYSMLVRQKRPVSALCRGLPFYLYPYMTLVQSSGSGKSRLLREVGQTLPLVYGNLNPTHSTGYPLPNSTLRRFLLWQSNASRHLAEAACEKRCEKLLLVAVIVFYSLFSSRDDTRKRLIMPRGADLRKEAEERAWQAVGIREQYEEPDGESLQSRGDLFWHIVVTLTERLLYQDANRSPVYWKEKCNTQGAPNVEDQLLELEKLLRELGETMLSPRGTNPSMSEIWDKSTTLTPTAENDHDRQPTPATESCSNTQRYSSRSEFQEGALNLLQRYLDIIMGRMKKTLSEVAKSLQQLKSQELLNVADTCGLCALFFAFDESRCLTTCTTRNYAFQGDNEQESTVRVFQCLRRVLCNMYEKNGVSVFMVFSDTNVHTVSKLANFVPQRSRDPPIGMMLGERREHPGQLFSPFVALGTESTGLMLAHPEAFDFRQRMKTFCAKWGSPNVESDVESVTEEITSFPREVLMGHLRANTALCTGARSEDEGEVEDEGIFRSDDDYVYLGRPLWASTMAHNQKRASWRHMVIFAVQKLLGGGVTLSQNSSLYATQCLAVLGCRVPLQFVENCGIAPQLIAMHMAWCTNVSWDRESVCLRYINEPLLVTAAAVRWETDLVDMLQCLVKRCGSYVSNKGDLSEVAACVLFTVAVDSAYKGRKEVSQEVSGGSDGDVPSPVMLQYEDELRYIPRGLTMFGIVTVKEFLESGFTLRVVTAFKSGILRMIKDPNTEHPVGHAWLSGAGASEGAPSPRSENVIFVPELLAAAQVRFKSIKRVTAEVGCRDFPFLFEANVAVLANRRHKGIDILIPLRMRIPCGNDEHQTKWSCLTVQVMNRRRSVRVSNVAGRQLDPKFTEAVNCDVNESKDCDRCSWMKENHFGIVLNVCNGAMPENERDFGPLWTYIDTRAHRPAVINKPTSSPTRKKRKLSARVR